MFQTKFVEKSILTFYVQQIFVSKIVLFMRKCGETGRTEMTIPSRIACWIPKATNTHSKYIILISSALQQWLREGASVLRYT